MPIYQRSLAKLGTHSLEPLVIFFVQVARTNFTFLGDAIINFLLYLYLSDFSDPLFAARPVRNCLALQYQCDSLLVACANSRTGIELDSKDKLFHTLWSLEQPLLPRLELQARMAKRPGVWKLMDTELIAFRVQSLFNMTRVSVQELKDEKESLIHTLAIFDMMEFLG